MRDSGPTITKASQKLPCLCRPTNRLAAVSTHRPAFFASVSVALLSAVALSATFAANSSMIFSLAVLVPNGDPVDSARVLLVPIVWGNAEANEKGNN